LEKKSQKDFPFFWKDFCGHFTWKPSSDLIRPLEKPRGIKGLLHMVNYSYDSYESKLEYFFIFHFFLLSLVCLLEEEQNLGVRVFGRTKIMIFLW